ncbi:MAG TPA: PPC domain-containing protein [Aggregatilineaceae bacterium]|nr:PPC domain-containing protein [Aggregatilineaceae bacterium]
MKRKRLFFPVILGIVLSLYALTVYAQDGTGSRQVSVGDVITATLDANTIAQTYTLPASAGDTVSVEVTTEVDALAPIVIMTDQRGNIVAQDLDTSSAAQATITDFSVPNNGIYYITVMRGTGADGDASGDFTLRISGIQQVGGATVNLTNGGLDFVLDWSAAVNLNLEVRDPVGGTVHAFNTGTASGGTLAEDVNVDCDAASADNPTETISWPAGDVPSGSYEVIIYYLDACSVGGPQQFTLNLSANGDAAQTLNGTINPGQRYLARLVLGPDASWDVTNGGVNAGLDVTVFGNEIANAAPVALGSTVSGQITNGEPAQAYTFDATANSTVDITLQAQSGSLDTYLALLAPDKTVLVVNDDANDETTDSFIQRNLVVDGTYTIIATRYGLTIGGTEGEYRLSVNTSTGTTTGTPAPGETPIPGEATPAPLPEGSIEVTLTWGTNADLQLQVRDPAGDTVYDDEPSIRSGGVLYADGNVGCQNTTTSPVSYIYWPPNRLDPGIYEVEVWYQAQCEDTAPVNFALSVTVNNQTVINSTPLPINFGARYLVTFEVAPDGTVTTGSADFFDMTNPAALNYQAQAASAVPLTYGQSVTGSITTTDAFRLYSFEGEQGDKVTIGLSASGGNLDTAVFLISPEGILVAYNDDVEAGTNSDSVISNVSLPSTGTYLIVATHYGLRVGGTTGNYTLDLRQQ